MDYDLGSEEQNPGKLFYITERQTNKSVVDKLSSNTR